VTIPGPTLVVCDNYDSFTFNLVQYLGELGASLDVVRNDQAAVDEIAARSPDGVVISPGPGAPSEAGISVELVRWCAENATPLLGVCLGHQAIGVAFGARVVEAPVIMHGKTSQVTHDGEGVFRDVANPFEAMRYHSLMLDHAPCDFAITARAGDVIMGIRHATLPIEGVQFHPESILTGEGKKLLQNFVTELVGRAAILRR
jgi:anthranilate synthase/aminodeoxychorismate synthase-like glutamine amidotransferase